MMDSPQQGTNQTPGPPVFTEDVLLSPQERLLRSRTDIGLRYRAFMADTALATIFGFVTALLLGPLFRARLTQRLAASGDLEGMGGLAVFYGILLSFSLGGLIGLTAAACMEAVTGASPGKRFLKIGIRHESGRPADRAGLVLRAVVKNLGVILAALAALFRSPSFGVLSLIAVLASGPGYMMAFGEKRQALHDRIAETAVYPRSWIMLTRDDGLKTGMKHG